MPGYPQHRSDSVPTHNHSQQSQEFDETCTAVLAVITARTAGDDGMLQRQVYKLVNLSAANE